MPEGPRVGIARAERGVLAVLAGGFFFMLFAATLGQNVGLAVFLERHGAAALPRAYVANALALAAVAGIATRAICRVSLRPAMTAAFALAALAAVVARAAHGAGAWWGPGALYVVAFVVMDVALVFFWALANRVYDTRDAKRLFPLLSAAGTLGCALSGFAARAVVAWTGTAPLLDAWAAMLAGCAAWSFVAAGRCGVPPGAGAPSGDDADGAHRGLWWAILAGLGLVVVVTLFGRYLYGLALREAYADGAALAAANGLLLGISSVLTLAVQVFVVPGLLGRLGAGVVGFVYPLAMLAAFLALRARFGLPTAVVCLFGITTLRQGVQGVVETVLYTPMPPRAASRALAFVSAAGMPAGMAAAGLGLELLGGAPPGTVAAWGAAAAAALLAAAAARSRAFRAALKERLLKGGSDVRVRLAALLESSNATVRAVLTAELSPDAPGLLDRLKTIVNAQRGGASASGARLRESWDPTGRFRPVVEARLRQAYHLHALLGRMPRIGGLPGVEDLWRGAVRARLGENLAVILAALHAGTRRADFDRISLRISDADRRVRAAAVEILDGLLPEHLRQLVVPLIEEKRLDDGRRAAARRYGAPAVDDPVEALFELPDDWIRATTAYAVAHLDRARYRARLEGFAASPDRFLSFAAAYALEGRAT